VTNRSLAWDRQKHVQQSAKMPLLFDHGEVGRNVAGKKARVDKQSAIAALLGIMDQSSVMTDIVQYRQSHILVLRSCF
jgi:hypothetical protein